MNSTPKGSVARLLLEVWSLGDTSAVSELIGELYTVFHDPGDPWDGQVLDRAGYTKRVLESRAPFPDQSFTIYDMLEEENKVAVTWGWKGTHRLPIGSIAATNRLVRMTGATVYSFEGPLIIGHWQVTDRLAVFRQLSAPGG